MHLSYNIFRQIKEGRFSLCFIKDLLFFFNVTSFRITARFIRTARLHNGSLSVTYTERIEKRAPLRKAHTTRFIARFRYCPSDEIKLYLHLEIYPCCQQLAVAYQAHTPHSRFLPIVQRATAGHNAVLLHPRRI